MKGESSISPKSSLIPTDVFRSLLSGGLSVINERNHLERASVVGVGRARARGEGSGGKERSRLCFRDSEL